MAELACRHTGRGDGALAHVSDLSNMSDMSDIRPSEFQPAAHVGAHYARRTKDGSQNALNTFTG